MRFYLTDEEYSNLYGKSLERKRYLRKIEQYNSIEAMEEKLKYKDLFWEFKVSAFNKIKAEIDSLIDNLKSGKEHIRNFEYVFDNPCDIFKYYDVTEEFQCTYDEEYGEITNGIEKSTFFIGDKQEIKLSFENLSDGFELGLASIDEIGKFILKHKSLKIADCIINGTT